jgi:hypothetical protein
MDYSGKIIKKTPVVPSQTSASGVWTLDEAMQATKSNTWPVANVPDPISRSLRFRSSASAYLNRTPATASNRRTWTYSTWIKRGLLTGSNFILSAGDTTSNNFTYAFFNATQNNCIEIGNANSGSFNLLARTAAVFRDPSAWYHIVLVFDTTNATSTSRVQLYVNGVLQTLSYTTGPFAQNTNSFVNNTNINLIGKNDYSTDYFDGYLAETYLIDGQALTPSSFGGTNAITGVWEPRPYTGTYGTNGFLLTFSDNTSTTTLGNDTSGNSNNWTTNNISLTAGSTYDSMLDVPTQWIAYGTDAAAVTRGNYCVLNPLDKSTNVTLSNGNLTATVSDVNFGTRSSMFVSSGKYYWEFTITALGSAAIVGISNSAWPFDYLGSSSGSYSYASTGDKYNNATATAYGATYTTGDIIGVALDLTAGTLTFYKNNTSQGTAFSSLSGTFCPALSGNGGTVTNANFGQRPFSYTPPAGFLSLCTTNLPSSTILQGNQYFDATLYTGNGSTQSIVNAAGFSPDLVWVKQRNGTGWNILTDIVRGANKQLYTNSTLAEGSDTAMITALNSNGFSVAYNGGTDVNGSGSSYVAWQWDANGAGVTNTAGSITSTVSANTTAGFSVVTYTGNGNAYPTGATVGHGLGVTPSMVIIKSRSTAGTFWPVYHISTGATNHVVLNNTTAASATDAFNRTNPTSTVFSIGQNTPSNETNASGGTYVAYCFAAVPGYSAFGSYTGNGSTDGTFVFTGFRPRFVLIKRTNASENWAIIDSSRDTYNLANKFLRPDESSAESSDGSVSMDLVSNGFKLRSTDTKSNANGSTYIYMAFAENPFKNALAR